MEPIARRTRRRTEEDLMRRYADWKKSQASTAPKKDPPAPQKSVISSGSSEGARRGSSDRTCVDRRLAKEEVMETGNVGERSKLFLISSSSESQEGDLVSESESSEIESSDSGEESNLRRVARKRDKEKEIEEPKRRDRKRPFTDVDGSHSRFNRSDAEVDGGGDDEDQNPRRKKLFDDHEEEEEIRVGREAPRVTEQSANRRVPKKPLTAGDIRRVLFNSIMDADDGVVKEPVSPHKTEDTASSSDNDDDSKPEAGSEKPEQETEVGSMYKLMDFCLSCDGNDADNDAADAFVEEEEAMLDARKSREQLCDEGKHHFVLEEEIGILCRSCGFVQEEITQAMPSFHHNPSGHSDRNRYSMYDHRDDECDNDQEDANLDPSGTVWEIIPGMRRTLLPHQREAFEFIWRKVAGGTKLDELTSNGAKYGGGCLISHAPGTGKTRLAIAFLETYMKLYKNSMPVILAPASILLTWKKEFEKWKVGIPFQNLIDEELSKDEISLAISIGIEVDESLGRTVKRLIKLLYWTRHESVLAISYTLFAQLAVGEDTKMMGRGKTKANTSRCLDESKMFRETLLDRPGLLILDEGHMPRNERSRIFKVLSEVKTKRRFILTGTPFQNNFRELHNILGLVMPKIWKKNPFNSSVGEADEHKIRELKAKMEQFIHCYEGGIVAKMVPGLNDNLVLLEPSKLQTKLIHDLDTDLKKSYYEANVDTARISFHPRLMELKDWSLGIDEELKSGKLDIADGAKTRFLIRLIELSLNLEEKVLVFSEYLKPLNFVKALLESSDRFRWTEGREILIMWGQQDMKTRKRNMDVFNKAGSEAKVMLASIRAAAEGIELTGASRVVLLDVTWNPARERQAISRAYRLGQGRAVHVYRLLMMTDYDSYRHKSQTHENRCSNYVFSSRNRNNDAPGSSKPASEDIILEQLLRENIVKETMQRSVCEPGVDNNRP